MTIAVGQHTFVTSTFTSGLTTTGIATSASGSNFYVFAGVSSTTTPTVSDNKGNTYTLITSDLTGNFGGIGVFAWKAENGTGGAGHTVTVSLANVGMAVEFIEVTGAATSGSVDASGHNGTNSQSTTITCATVTTTNANDLILSFWKSSNTGNTSIASNTGAGYALVDSQTANPAFAASSRVVSSTGTYGDTYTVGTAAYQGTITLAILPAGAGPPPPVGNSLIRTPGPGPGYPFNPLLMLGRTGSTQVPLGGSAAVTFGQTGAITGAGALAGSSALVFGESGALTGAGVLAGTSALVFAQSGTLTQPGLAGSSALLFGQTAALAGSGALSGTTALTFAQTGTLVAAGILAGTSPLLFAQTAALAGSGALTGTSPLTFAAAGTADVPSGAIVGTSALSLGQSGTLSAFGALIGNCQIVMGATGFVPAPTVTTEVPAGRRIRNIYRVTIDGQVFEFRTLQEALDLLNRAKELAAKVAEDQEIWKELPKAPPVITVSSRELRKAAAETKREIKATYEKAALHAELRMLLELSRRQEEDDTLLLLT